MSIDKTIRRVTDFKEQRMETYRYWRSRPCAERMAAVEEIVRSAYLSKGIDLDQLPGAPGLDFETWNFTILRLSYATPGGRG
ncbi:MAG: hypothetical protein ABR991_01835 [Terracidiphilus sp.]|jgi:hypothetical protein